MNLWVLVNFASCWNFPGGPVVKPLLSNAEGPGSIPGWDAKISLPCDQNTKTQNNIVTNLIKTLKWSTSKKIFKKLWREWTCDLYLEILYHTWPRNNLKVGDVEKGKMISQKCTQCHTVETGTSTRLGQTLMLCLGEMQFRPLDSLMQVLTRTKASLGRRDMDGVRESYVVHPWNKNNLHWH